MDKINDGGPAFPTTQGMGSLARKHIGLSMRDYFAAKALSGLLSSPRTWISETACNAEMAYELADAMLRAREET